MDVSSSRKCERACSSVSPASRLRFTQKPGLLPKEAATAFAWAIFSAAPATDTPWKASTSPKRAASSTASADSAGSEITGRGSCTGLTPEYAPRTW